MRFKIEMELKNEQFPLDYRSVVISLLKQSLTEYDGGKHLCEYFEVGKAKPYTFAVGLPGSTFKKDKILVPNKKINITFSTGHIGTGILFFNALMIQRNKSYPLAFGNAMTITNILVEKEFIITTDKINIIFKSPLCVREHSKQNNKDFYHSYEKERFNEVLLKVLKAQIEKDGTLPLTLLDGFSMTPLKCKKTVIKHYSQFIEATLGIFTIRGNIALLGHLYANGMASRKSSGFGMFEIIKEGVL